MDTTLPLERAHLDSSNNITKGFIIALKKVERFVRATTWKANQKTIL
jgi:hypothetical protein